MQYLILAKYKFSNVQQHIITSCIKKIAMLQCRLCQQMAN